MRPKNITKDKDTKRRLNKYIDNLSKEPLSGPYIKRLHGKLEVKYRYVMGGFRIVYEINIKNKTVEIKSVGGRGVYLASLT